MRPRFSRFIGVDFSASVIAGRGIWIAVGMPAGSQLVVDRLLPAKSLPGSATERSAALDALRRFLADQTGALVGLDFPFGLPASMVDAPDWRSFVLAFRERYPDADGFRAACRARTGGRELKRRTDYEARTPFAAYNLRVYRQTWWGIAEILGPLLAVGAATAPPMVPADDTRPALAEICPASTLKRIGVYPSYKGRGVSTAAGRAAILDRMATEGVVFAGDLARIALADPGGDALDAVVAAFACWQVAQRPEDLRARDDIDRIEARVLF